jgi:hypothetical protein
MTDPRGVCARPAATLRPGVAYVRGWAEGTRAADILADPLRAAGLDDDFPSLKADVNVIGQGVVHLGPVRPETAAALARLLAAGIAAEREQQRPDSP